MVASRDALGCWGWVEAYRDRCDRPFHEDDLELLASVGSGLGPLSGAAWALCPRCGMCTGRAHNRRDRAQRGPAGVDVTAGARAWIGAFPQAVLFAAWGMLPAVVYPRQREHAQAEPPPGRTRSSGSPTGGG